MKIKILFGLIVVLLFLAGCSNSSRVYDDFARCLSEKGAVMYGTYWCSHCNAQKREFGDSFRLVNYVECSVEKNKCIDDGIEAFPSWIIDGKLYKGKQSLSKFSSLTNCELPQIE